MIFFFLFIFFLTESMFVFFLSRFNKQDRHLHWPTTSFNSRQTSRKTKCLEFSRRLHVKCKTLPISKLQYLNISSLSGAVGESVGDRRLSEGRGLRPALSIALRAWRRTTKPRADGVTGQWITGHQPCFIACLHCRKDNSLMLMLVQHEFPSRLHGGFLVLLPECSRGPKG